MIFLLKGALNTLNKTQCVIVEQNVYAIRQLLPKNGFRLLTFYPSGYLIAFKKS